MKDFCLSFILSFYILLIEEARGDSQRPGGRVWLYSEETELHIQKYKDQHSEALISFRSSGLCDREQASEPP